MSPARWEQIKEVLAQVLQTPENRREDVLRTSCEGDGGLEREVRELLERNYGTSSFKPAASALFSAQPPGADPPFRAGETVANRFQLIRLLGRGGMGQVWEAFDQLLGVKLAVKTLRLEFLADSAALNRFHREILTARGVTHRHICRVYDLYLHEDSNRKIPLLTMELIQGETVAQRLARGALSASQAVTLLEQCAEALGAAHRVGVIHRDFKPGNIMLADRDGGELDAVVMDFGLARLLQNEDGASLTAGGTPGYVPPEQLAGKDISASADVYSFAVVACELLTTLRPFDGGLELLPNHWREPVRKALDVEPDRRPASPTALLYDVKSAKNRKWIRLSSVAVLAALLFALFFVFRLRNFPPPPDTVAVLPFKNSTGDPSLAYLSEGLTESLISDLSRIPTLRVSALGSVMKYQDRKLDVRAIGRELGADRLIDGSFSMREHGLFIETELVDVATGARVWGKDYSSERSSLTDVLQRFSSEVTDQLRLKLSGPLLIRLKRQYAVGSQAYDEYLKARYHLGKRTAADFDQAIQHFREVATSNPEYAPGHAGLAETWAWMSVFGGPYLNGAEPRDAWEHARDSAKRALQLDGTLAEAYNALAMVEEDSDFDWAAASANYRRSIDLNPNFAQPHENYGWELAALGQTAEAVREMNLAQKLEPDNSHIRSALALVLYMGRRYDEALKICQDIVQTPGGVARVGQLMAMSYWMTSRPEEAQKVISSAPKELSELFMPLTITALCRLGERNRAKILYDKYYLHNGRTWWYAFALANLSMQRADEAVADLEKAYEERSGEVIWIGVDPLFDPLRSNPRFRRLLNRVNLPQKPI
jgi:eukaryotic-like serine/threonine-protein kinase